jgi:outer membrane murein-binding lipoprotein Lpp
MPKQTGKRNKLAARSLVVAGTLLAGAAIWMSVLNTANPSSQVTTPLSDTSSPVTTLTIDSNEVASTVQPPAPTTTNRTQQVVPRFRTRGS